MATDVRSIEDPPNDSLFVLPVDPDEMARVILSLYSIDEVLQIQKRLEKVLTEMVRIPGSGLSIN